MSENKKPKRTIPEIQQEYKNLCLKAGYLQYQVYNAERDLAMVNDELRDLNLEAASVKAAEAEAAKPAEAPKAAPQLAAVPSPAEQAQAQ